MASRTTLQLDGADLLIGQNFIGNRGALIAEQCREVHWRRSLCIERSGDFRLLRGQRDGGIHQRLCRITQVRQRVVAIAIHGATLDEEMRMSLSPARMTLASSRLPAWKVQG
ncbi:hypothetical protein P4133_10815 [Pseudomonas aeruginosa]|nr:hypothetical protein [Pseudomonas aeruginosa]